MEVPDPERPGADDEIQMDQIKKDQITCRMTRLRAE